MNIIDVIPIAKGVSTESLSYFTKETIPLGSMVEVPLRKRLVFALVISTRTAANDKSALRASSFSMRKVAGNAIQSPFSPAFVEAVQYTAHYCATQSGTLFAEVVPRAIRENISHIPPALGASDNQEEVKEDALAYVVEDTQASRFETYRNTIKEELDRGRSVFIFCPTGHDCDIVYRALSGSFKHAYLLRPNMSSKKTLTTWSDAATQKSPILLIASGAFVGLARADIGTIIIEHESSQSWKGRRRPYADLRTLIETYARNIHARLIVADSHLSVQTYKRRKDKELSDFIPSSGKNKRAKDIAKKIRVDDMRHGENRAYKEFTVLGNDVCNLIRETAHENKHVFLFAARRGLSGAVLCNDCGHRVACARCGASVVLHKGSPENFFLCHHCADKRSAKELCSECGSWNLAGIGIGIERVAEELMGKFPDIPLFRFDSDSIKTAKAASACIATFYATPGSILLGTEMAAPYLETVDNSAVISLDSFFAIADFKINEKVFFLVSDIASKTKGSVVIQTRDPDQKAIRHLLDQSTDAFYADELEERKLFGFPPFCVFIKITVTGKVEEVQNQIAELGKLFSETTQYALPQVKKNARGQLSADLLLTVSKEEWPDNKLIKKLLSLPPHVSVCVDPRSIF